jgi:hypothetical protein
MFPGVYKLRIAVHTVITFLTLGVDANKLVERISPAVFAR